MKWFVLVTCFFALSSCSLDKVYKDYQIRKFWSWFDDNKSSYEDIQDDQDEKLTLVLDELRKIDDGLSIEISVNQSIHAITISAEGDMERFPLVKEIVAKAPFVEGWKITAFRQPVKNDFALKYKNIKLAPSELYYSPIIEGDSLDVIVFGKGFKNYDQDELAHYGLVMLDNLMGEYNCVTKVRYYDFQDLKDSDGYDLKPLSEINLFIKSFYKAKKVSN